MHNYSALPSGKILVEDTKQRGLQKEEMNRNVLAGSYKRDSQTEHETPLSKEIRDAVSIKERDLSVQQASMKENVKIIPGVDLSAAGDPSLVMRGALAHHDAESGNAPVVNAESQWVKVGRQRLFIGKYLYILKWLAGLVKKGGCFYDL